MVLHRMVLRGLVITAAAASGCAQVGTSDAGHQATHEEAKQVDVEMDVLHGLLYSMGKSKNYGKAFALFRKAADQGNPNGEYGLAECYEAGRGVEKNESKAVFWYRKAAEQRLVLARARLRTMFVQGKLVPVDDGEGGTWWRGLAAQAADESQSFYRAYAAAGQNDADAEVMLGIDYLTGVGTRKDRTQATWLFQQAAGQGQSEAQCFVSAIFASDDDWAIPSETKHAADLCLNAANHGYADAQLVLGTFYATGRGVTKDPAQATFWYRKAAERGRPDAAFILGFDYEHGDGVHRDETQSVFWFRKAADQRYSPAMMTLGLDASFAHTLGKEDPLHDPALAQKFIDLSAEYSAEGLERDLLHNLEASRAEQERDRQLQKRLGRILAPKLKAMGVE